VTWEEFIRHIPTPASVVVEPYQGSGAYGDVYGAPTAVTPCVVEATRRLVRVQTQDAAGSEAVSSTTVYAPPDTVAPPGSLVTLPSGHVARVLAVAVLDDHGIGLPSHLEISLE